MCLKLDPLGYRNIPHRPNLYRLSGNTISIMDIRRKYKMSPFSHASGLDPEVDKFMNESKIFMKGILSQFRPDMDKHLIECITVILKYGNLL